MRLRFSLLVPLALIGCDPKGDSDDVDVDWRDTGDRWSAGDEPNGGTDSGGDDSGGTDSGGDDSGATDSGDDDASDDDGDTTGSDDDGDTTGSDDDGDTTGSATGDGDTGADGEEEEEEEEPPEDDCADPAADIWEPNDAEGEAEDFGDKDGEEFDITGAYLYPDTDVDRYTFSVTDGLIDGLSTSPWFDVQVRLTGVPTTVDLKLDLYHVTNESGEPGEGLVASSDEAAAGGDEEVSIDETELTFWSDRGGQYEIVVSSNSGSDCTSPYTLSVSADTR